MSAHKFLSKGRLDRDSGAIMALASTAATGAWRHASALASAHELRSLTIRPVASKADRKRLRRLRLGGLQGRPGWVPPLKDEVHGLLDPKKNPWFGHAPRRSSGWRSATASRRADQRAGRRSGPGRIWAQGTGQWGMFEALDGEAAAALIATAEEWLREQGMTRALGPISISIWDEPGLEIEGFAEPPTVMMGHHRPEYRGWIEAAGYAKAKDLLTYELDIAHWYDPLIDRLIAPGEQQPAHPHPQRRQVEVRRGSAAHPQPAQRCLVGQLGLRPADRGRDRLCRQETEADHLRGPGPDRRIGWRAGRVHADLARHQRADRRPERQAVPVRLGQAAVAAAQAADAAGARAADGRGEEAPRHRLASQLAFMLIEFTRRAVRRQVRRQPSASSAGSSRTIRGCCRSPNCPAPTVNHRYRIYEKRSER